MDEQGLRIVIPSARNCSGRQNLDGSIVLATMEGAHVAVIGKFRR